MKTKVLVGCVFVLLALVTGWSMWWWYGTSLMQDRLTKWAAAQEAKGYTIRWESLDRTGYPLQLGLEIKKPEVTLPTGWHWSAPLLRIAGLPIDVSRLKITQKGINTIDLHGMVFMLESKSARANVNVTLDGALEHLALDIKDIKVRRPAEIWPDPITIKGVVATLERDDDSEQDSEQDWQFSMGMREGHIPFAPAPLNQPLTEMDARATIKMGRDTIINPSSAAPSPSGIVARWSQQGGLVELTSLHLDWPPMFVDGDGTLALDDKMQPLAAFALRMQGLGALIELGQSRGLIKQGASEAARIVLQLLAQTDPNGNNSVLVPVTIQDQNLYFGPAKLMSLPRWQWP